MGLSFLIHNVGKLLDALNESEYTVITEKEMAAHSGILAWRILWAEEPGGSPWVSTEVRTPGGRTSWRLR